MSIALLILLLVFVALILVDAPIMVALGLASVAYLLVADTAPLIVVAQRMIAGIDSFTLLAIPLFLLAGQLMVHGGLAPRIVSLCAAIVGQRTGGLAIVMIAACMLFGSLSGSGVADVVAIGSMMLPAMKDRGYHPGFSASALGCAGSLAQSQSFMSTCRTMLALQSAAPSTELVSRVPRICACGPPPICRAQARTAFTGGASTAAIAQPRLSSRIRSTACRTLPSLSVSRAALCTVRARRSATDGALAALIALAIRRDSPGPVIFRQMRVGKDGRPFMTYKFRTMVADAEERRAELAALNEADGPIFKIRNDPRMTAVGRLLRRTSLDELPQFWNVLRGEMSLVGPRPPTPDEVASYAGWHQRRLDVTPGLINRHEGVPFLPVGFVQIDRERRRVLVEFPCEAYSGANRAWIPFETLRHEDRPVP